MSQGAGAFAALGFPGSIFLRWDVAGLALAAALLFAFLCTPQIEGAKHGVGT
jgi:hypothetical protein